MEDKNVRAKREEIKKAVLLGVDADLIMGKVDTYAEMVASRRINAVLGNLAGKAHRTKRELEAQRGARG